MAVICVNQVTKNYGRLTALNDVSFTVKKGQVLGLLGQNGAGKSTLLNILSGYLSASSGNVIIHDADMLLHPLEAKAHIGYLPETPPLYIEMTVIEYLRFCCNLKGVVKADQVAHIDELIQLTGLTTVANRLIAHLSRGYRQRVGLAQALCGNPEVLLLDEPTAGFDPAQVVEFRGIIKMLAEKHTILFSSHVLSEVQAICERMLILHQGRLVYDQGAQDDSFHTSTRQFQLRIGLEKEQLLPALRGLPSVTRVKATLSESGITEALVDTPADSRFERELMTLLAGLQAPIMALIPLRDSLEDIFMRITSTSAQQQGA